MSSGRYEERLIKKRSKVSKRELETLNDNNSKRARRDLPKCPICEYRIEPDFWADHYQYELSRLADPTSEAFIDPLNKNKGKRGAALLARKQLEGKGKKKAQSVHEETLERIQKNRTKRNDRLKHMDNSNNQIDDSQVALQMMQEEAAAVQGDVQTCFICNEQLFGDLDAINLHIDNCLSTQQEEDEDEEIDDIDDEPSPPQAQSSSSGWEEYEWAGQRRVRATAMMEGGYGGAGFATTSKVEVDDDEDIDLDVEDDDAAQYGTSQYSERDIVVQMDNEDDSTLREMVSGAVARTPPTKRRQGFEETVSVSGWDTHSKEESSSTSSNLVIESLKSRIRELERTSKSNHCLICLEPYKTPLTSIVCWHVHCEQCWLQTLGTKKLCPQCQKITTPSDLRRIYL